MIIFYKKINFFKILSMISFCMALLIFSLINLPHYYPLPTVVASFKGCSEYSMEYISTPVLECSFVDSTGYMHIVNGYSRDTFNNMKTEPVNKMFTINNSRYEDAISLIMLFAALTLYISLLSCLIMIPFFIAKKVDNDFEEFNSSKFYA